MPNTYQSTEQFERTTNLTDPKKKVEMPPSKTIGGRKELENKPDNTTSQYSQQQKKQF